MTAQQSTLLLTLLWIPFIVLGIALIAIIARLVFILVSKRSARGSIAMSKKDYSNFGEELSRRHQKAEEDLDER